MTLSQTSTACIGPISADDVRVAGEFACRWLRTIDPPCPRANRFEQYLPLLSRRHTPHEARAVRQIADAYVSSLQLYFTLAFTDWQAPARGMLDRLIGGSPAGGYSENAAPWDAQAELFSYAALHASGLADVRFAEPDLLIPAGPSAVGVAVKRLTTGSVSSAIRRLRRARQQLKRQAVRGIAAMEIAVPPTTLYGASELNPLEPLAQALNAVIVRRQYYDALLGFILFRMQPAGPRTGDSAGVLHLDIAVRAWLYGEESDAAASLADWVAARGRRLATNLALALDQLRIARGTA